MCAVKLAAADVLERAAAALDRPDRRRGRAARSWTAAREQPAGRRCTSSRTTRPRCRSSTPRQRRREDRKGRASAATVVSALDPSFRAQELAYVTDQIAVERRVRRCRRHAAPGCSGCSDASRPASPDRSRSARERALAHAEPSSSWLHNSLRGATGPRAGGARRRPDVGPARLLGRVRDARGAALQRAQHRPERRCARCSGTTRRLHRRRCAGGADRDQHGACCGCCCRSSSCSPGLAPVGDLLRRRPGGVHRHAAGAVQPAGAGRLEARTGADRGRRHRRRGQPRRRPAVLAARGGRRARPRARTRVRRQQQLPGGGRRLRRSRAATPAARGGGSARARRCRPPPRRAGSTTPSAATSPSAAPRRSRWPR